MTHPLSTTDLLLEQMPRIQQLARRGNALAEAARRMLFALDRYWKAYEGGSPSGFDEMWWCAYERERRKVENLIRDDA